MQVAKRQTMWGDSSLSSLKCLVLDGTYKSAMTSAVGETYTLGNEGSFTISLWAYVIGKGYGTEPNLWSLFNYTGTYNTGPCFIAYHGNDVNIFVVYQGAAVFPSSTTNLLTYSLNEWHNFTLCCDKSSGASKIYIDGMEKYSYLHSSWLKATSPLYAAIGGLKGYTDRTPRGYIANVNFWRKALSSLEISTLASDMNFIPSDAYHQWMFEDMDGTDTGDSEVKLNVIGGETTTFVNVDTITWGGVISP